MTEYLIGKTTFLSFGHWDFHPYLIIGAWKLVIMSVH